MMSPKKKQAEEDQKVEEEEETAQPLSREEILVVAQDYLARANELIRHARSMK